MRNGLLLLLLILLAAAPGAAQPQAGPMNNVGAANLPAQAIGVDDLVSISVYRSPELTRTARVSGDGTITLPLVESPIRAAGLMPVELEQAVARALKDGGILVSPIVEVTVAEYASRPISVMGAVKKPLTFQAVGRVTLLDALARAEGLAPEASGEILVTLPGADADGGKPLVRRIPVSELIDEAKPELNLPLRGGEEVRVPEAGKIFVVGNVKKPGAYPFPEAADASVMKLIARAEGLMPYHRKLAYLYRKDGESGLTEEIEIELARMLKREVPDMALEIDDVLYVPDNPGKRSRNKALERATAFGAATVSGLLIWR